MAKSHLETKGTSRSESQQENMVSSGHTSLAELSYLSDSKDFSSRNESTDRLSFSSTRNHETMPNNRPSLKHRDSLVSIGSLWDECDADPLGFSAMEHAEQPIEEPSISKDFDGARVSIFAKTMAMLKGR